MAENVKNKVSEQQPTSVHLSTDIKKEIAVRAAETGMKKGEVIETALRAYLAMPMPAPAEPQRPREVREAIAELEWAWEHREDSKMHRLFLETILTTLNNLARNADK